MKKGLKLLFFIFLFCVNLGIIENVFAKACTKDADCGPIMYCSVNMGTCENKHPDGYSQCNGKNNLCLHGNCLNGTCQAAGLVATGTTLEGIDPNYIYDTKNCNDKCPKGSDYVCSLYDRKYNGSTVVDQYKCTKNVSGYIKTTCLTMSFGLPIEGMKKGDCVDFDQGIPNLLKFFIQFILASIGTLATILVIVAGFMWSFSAGNPKAIKKATDMLKNAGIGLILVIFSGSILAIVNPALINTSVFKAIKIKSVNIPEISEDSSAIQRLATAASGSGGDCYSKFPANNNIASLDDKFEEFAKRMMALPECSGIKIVETLREQNRQDCLYSIGRTTSGAIVTYAAVSQHSSGTALDLLYTDVAKLKSCADACAKANICVNAKCSGADIKKCKCTYTSGKNFSGIFWGGNWEPCHFVDKPHFEYISLE